MIRGVTIFERKHLMETLLFIYDCGGKTTRMALYNNVANDASMPEKLEILEGFGLIRQVEERVTRTMHIELSDHGHEVAKKLTDIDRVMGPYITPSRTGRY